MKQKPQPFNLYMIIRRVGEIEIMPVYAHTSIQAVAYYCQKEIKQPWREKEFRAGLIESPAKRQPKSYRNRLAKYQKYQAKLATAKKPAKRMKAPAPKRKRVVKKSSPPSFPDFPAGSCQNCGYHDPHFGKGVNCPNCGN